jgi:hypothetical protein
MIAFAVLMTVVMCAQEWRPARGAKLVTTRVIWFVIGNLESQLLGRHRSQVQSERVFAHATGAGVNRR